MTWSSLVWSRKAVFFRGFTTACAKGLWRFSQHAQLKLWTYDPKFRVSHETHKLRLSAPLNMRPPTAWTVYKTGPKTNGMLTADAVHCLTFLRGRLENWKIVSWTGTATTRPMLYSNCTRDDYYHTYPHFAVLVRPTRTKSAMCHEVVDNSHSREITPFVVVEWGR